MLNQLLKNLAVNLHKNNIPYVIIGGQAALLYREPRFTNDIDILLGIGQDGADRIIKFCSELNFRILVDNPSEFISDTMVLPAFDDSSNFRIDFIFSMTDYELEAINRANRINIEETQVAFCSLEDLIILKIFAGRNRDLEDVRVIIRKNPNYNSGLVRETLIELGKAIDVDLISRLDDIENNC